MKKHGTKADSLPIQIYINEIKNHVVFNIKTGYKLEFLSKETIKLLGSTEKVADKNKNCENVPKLEIADIILMHYNNNYQQALNILLKLVPNKQFGQLIILIHWQY